MKRLLHINKNLRPTLVAVLALCLLAGVLAVRSTPQAVLPGPAAAEAAAIDPDVMAELARLAILEPNAFAAEIEKTKTAEEILADQISAFAILEPAAYAAEEQRFKTQEQLDAEALSLMAVLEPEKYNAMIEPLKTPEQRQQEAESAFAILNPQRGSGTHPDFSEPSQP